MIYEVIMGSMAYGVSLDSSDEDVYGFCIPPKRYLFPSITGEIEGFGTQHQRFHQWQSHHVIDQSASKEYDFSIYNISKYFQLCMENNPNMIDSLFVPNNCVLHTTEAGLRIREQRKLFLHKGSWHKFKGYAYAQMTKVKNKKPSNEKRAETVAKHGYDTKFAYHIVRLINEVEQILVTHDLDLQQNNEQLKAIRRGEWTFEQLESWFLVKERELENIYLNSTLRQYPDEEAIRKLLLEVLEEHYGNLESVLPKENKFVDFANDLKDLMVKYKVA